ncbi:hypothetical protein F4811DRAFT_291303 [Daldinia bambusicola]|nr:hypothetical protein F4811DRAFT_291303 [Daldinia bambusicola]
MRCLKEIAGRRVCCKRRQSKVAPPKASENRGNGDHVVATDYVPRDRVVQETLKYLCSGSRYDLAKLLEERDCVERQACWRRKAEDNTKTKNNNNKKKKKVKCECVAHEPSISSVEQLDQACRYADIAARYKLPGRMSYNFSRSSEWNRINLSETPSPTPSPSLEEDPDEGTTTTTTSTTITTREPSGIFNPYFTESDFDLSGFSFSLGPSMSSVIEARDLSDWAFVSAAGWDMWRASPPLMSTLYPIQEEDEEEEEEQCEGDVTEARALTMTNIPIWQVRRICIPPRLRLKIPGRWSEYLGKITDGEQ